MKVPKDAAFVHTDPIIRTRPDPSPDPRARPYTHLAASEQLELMDYVGQPALRAYDWPQRYWQAHTYFARHAALTLARGDLWAAQRTAAISTYALTLYTRSGQHPPVGPEADDLNRPAGCVRPGQDVG